MINNDSQSGFVLLLSTLVLIAVGAIAVGGMFALGVWDSKSLISLEQGMKTRALADSCAEAALDRLKEDPSYTGTETFAFQYGSCSIGEVTEDSGIYTIKAVGSYSNTFRRVLVTATRSDLPNAVQVISWKEVGDF